MNFFKNLFKMPIGLKGMYTELTYYDYADAGWIFNFVPDREYILFFDEDGNYKIVTYFDDMVFRENYSGAKFGVVSNYVVEDDTALVFPLDFFVEGKDMLVLDNDSELYDK